MMARIRSLKPEFWDDRKLARSCSRDARMLYMGLWNQADEHARLNGDVVWLKGRVFPYEDDLTPDRIEGLLDELDQAGRIVRYDADGDPFIHIPTLPAHQRLEPDKVSSKIPDPPSEPDACSSAPRADRVAPDAGSSTLLYGAGSMEHGEGDAEATPGADPPAFCPRHMPNGTDEPCAPCGRRRRALDVWTRAKPERDSAARASRLATRRACTGCDENGMTEDLRRCTHDQQAAS